MTMKPASLLVLLAILGLSATGLAVAPSAPPVLSPGSRGADYTTSFDRIHVEGPIRAVVRIGPHHSVAPEKPGSVRVTISNGTALISPAERSSQPQEVAIFLPRLDALTASDGGQVSIQGIDRAGEIMFTVRGGGEIKAEGTADEVHVEIRGNGLVDLAALKAETASAKVEGSGTIRLFASNTLSASVAGDGTVEYAGDPRNLAQAVSGTGTIRRY
jgi:Putative auto-transporter adhesin, head GIN domain